MFRKCFIGHAKLRLPDVTIWDEITLIIIKQQQQAQQVELMLIDSNYPGEEEEDSDWVFSLWDRCFHMLQKSDLGSWLCDLGVLFCFVFLLQAQNRCVFTLCFSLEIRWGFYVIRAVTWWQSFWMRIKILFSDNPKSIKFEFNYIDAFCDARFPFVLGFQANARARYGKIYIS